MYLSSSIGMKIIYMLKSSCYILLDCPSEVSEEYFPSKPSEIDIAKAVRDLSLFATYCFPRPFMKLK